MVLDLPAEVGTGMATSRWFWFQTVHQRPIADLCIVSPGQPNPRLLLQRATLDSLLSGETAATGDLLRRLGFTSVVVHAGLFRASDRTRLLAALEPLGELRSSTDGGEWVVAVELGGAPAVTDREAVAAAWQEWRSP